MRTPAPISISVPGNSFITLPEVSSHYRHLHRTGGKAVLSDLVLRHVTYISLDTDHIEVSAVPKN